MSLSQEKDTEKNTREPNKEQKKCIETKENKYLVIAGPGTGKTFTVSQKIKYLVEIEKINPERILCLTFSDTAAREMRDKAGEKYPINVFTFHGFCLDIIQNFSEDFDFENINIIIDSHKRSLINECIEEIHSKNNFIGYNNIQNNPYKYAKEILDGIEEIKKNRISKTQFFENLETNPLWIPRKNQLPEIISEKKLLFLEKEKELSELENKANTSKELKKILKDDIKLLKKETKDLKKEIDDILPKQLQNITKSICQMNELWSLYELYEKKKKLGGFIDFHDMINSVLEKFDDKSSSILRTVADTYDYVLVDEYQDTNTAQNEIVFQLAKYCPNIFVVGDDDQIIFTFQGAHTDTIEKFIKNFELQKENINCLKDNHRSTEAVLKAAYEMSNLQDEYALFKFDKRNDDSYLNKLIPLRLSSKSEFKELGIDKQLNPANKNLHPLNKSIEYKKFNSKDEEICSIVNAITEILNPESKYKTPEKLSEIAILARTNEELEEYETYLKAKGISVEFAKGKNIFKINSVAALIAYMQFLISPEEYSDKMFSYLLMMPFHINPADYVILKNISKNKSKTLISNMSKLLEESASDIELRTKIYAVLNSDTNTLIEDIQNLILKASNDISSAPKYSLAEPDKIENFIKTYNYLKKYVTSENYKNSILEIGNQTGIFNYYFNNEINRSENIKGINKLINEADSYFSVHKNKSSSFSDFVTYITLLLESGSEILTEKDDKPANAVQLSTYHSSKGREFEYVFMPNLHRQKWEDRDISKSNQIQEIIPSHCEKNNTFESLNEKIDTEKFLDNIKLLYVGITRAKYGLILSCAENSSLQLSWFIKQFLERIKNIKLSNGVNLLKYSEVVISPEYILPVKNYDYKEFEKCTLPQKHSPSSLNIYLNCPLQYFFKYVLSLKNYSTNDENDNSAFGTAIHETFEKIIKFAKENKKYPDSLEEVINIFDDTLSKQNLEHFEDAKKRGIILFKNYYEKLKTLADPEKTLFESEIGLTEKLTDENLGEITFYGKLDRIDTDENDLCTIYDYKTGENSDGITKGGNHKNYYYQMGFYKYLLQKQGKNVQKVCFIYPEIQDDKNEIYIEKLTDKECEIIAQEYIDAVKKINNFEFEKSDKAKCTYCNYIQLCKNQKII